MCPVSIHATLAGGDRLCRGTGKSGTCFYPRHPRGWRRLYFLCVCKFFCFYPRHPRGWRLDDIRYFANTIMFLSTPPSRVATSADGVFMSGATSFYPRHPRGWRPGATRTIETVYRVSIHATLAGGDTQIQAAYEPINQFLSTPPSRVATIQRMMQDSLSSCFYPRHPRGWRQDAEAADRYKQIVSIHATLAGGDKGDVWQTVY